MGMKIHGGYICIGITIGDSGGFSSWGRTTIENARAVSDKSRNELRGFVLNYAKARSERGRLGEVSLQDSSGRGKENAGSEFDPLGAELCLYVRTTKTDCGHRNRLIVLANAKSRGESVGLGPAFDQPARMRAVDGQSLG